MAKRIKNGRHSPAGQQESSQYSYQYRPQSSWPHQRGDAGAGDRCRAWSKTAAPPCTPAGKREVPPAGPRSLGGKRVGPAGVNFTLPMGS